MAIDNTPPRLKLIVTIAVITVITLVAINFVTESYYAMMSDEAQREKLAPTREKDEQLKAEMAALTGAAMPVDKAMAALAKGDRPAAIAPQQSDDIGAVTGWSKLPKPAPQPQPRAEPAPAVPGDGGAPLTADGGAAAPSAADAGPATLSAGADGGRVEPAPGHKGPGEHGH